ncbi:hypothetical protein PGT21_023895 [Puccinia graminis f. sp. tritici]|uniref:Uncharacterized protein n=1 Tax=Puccinia graminis f. sp. tritici TaxID=56615 RepID=A0A5B0N4H1_PUCGR|nr:hypothetical protein PGT21_023895 [Puccinia graminis f. sp. tritici]KAA1124016.1 hypothetical protein PGTUg99_020173 [Puccinia graminis f. sp. tritici]
MRVTTISLFGFLLSPLGSLAQDISIASPTKDSNVTPGQKLKIVLQAQGTTSSVKHIAFSTGFRATSKHDDKSLGRPTVGSVSPGSPDVAFDASKGTYTYEITVPAAKDFLDGFSAPYELTVSDLYLLGATFTPTLKLTSVQVNVQNNNSTGGDSPADPNSGNNSTNPTPNSTDPNGGKGSNSSPTPSSDPNSGSSSNSNKPSSGAASHVHPSAVYSACFLLAACLLAL